MRKIIFLTLMMILGMSSVSLGNSYLCISEVNRMFFFSYSYNKHVVSDEKKEEKFIIKTEGLKKIVSVKEVGKDFYLCGVGKFKPQEGLGKGKVVSFKGGDLLTCRTSYIKEDYGGHTYNEIILDLKRTSFIYFKNVYSSVHQIGQSFITGICEEI